MKGARRAIAGGSVAGVVTTLALLALARRRGIAPWRAVNCTAHWLHGEGAAEVVACDLRHTGVGFGTNLLACVFWAAILEWALGRFASDGRRIWAWAALVALIAIPADYLATPKRFTPGWELVLRKREMGVVYAAMALGLGWGARIVRR